MIRPDFTMVDGSCASVHGHYPPVALHHRTLVPFNILVAGRDTLAVDVVCARIFGYSLDEVEHLKRAAEFGTGVCDLESIRIEGKPLSESDRRYPYTLVDAFPPDVRVIGGKEKSCVEGCYGNTMALLQVLYLDLNGKGGFTIVMGRGLDRGDVDYIKGKVFVAGGCAFEEVGKSLIRRLGKRNVLFTDECNDLAGTAGCLTRLMGVNPMSMAPLNPLRSLSILTKAKARGTTARIPPLIPRP